MCGIAGIQTFKDQIESPELFVKKMMHLQYHRGPDASGVYTDSQISLGHRRLSIIDLNKSADQPMQNEKYSIVFNGELYNFIALKSKLKNYRFKTKSDTEVILAAFEEWGENCVKYFKGQFSFAIWDKHKKQLFIARDRLGEKPFYYYHDESIFLFASEIRPIINSGLIKPTLSRQGLNDFFIRQSVHSPNTIISKIFQLPAAHFGWVKCGKLTISSYWDITNINTDIRHQPYINITKSIKRKLLTSIEGQMISDVPIGAFLSGGIDSSAIVGLMAELSDKKINTLSITFDNQYFDESPYSSMINKRFHTNHHEIRLKPDTFLSQIDDYFNSIDTPSEDGPNTYVISKAAKKIGLTVALSGIGGDELFAGYSSFSRFYQLNKKKLFWKLPVLVRGLLFQIAKQTNKKINIEKLEELFRMKSFDVISFYELMRRSHSQFSLSKILSPINNKSIGSDASLNTALSSSFRSLPLLSQYSVLELNNYTQNVLLKDTDNMSMANSLEIRVPFFDHELVSYVLAVPDKYKFPSSPKKLLIDSLDGLLPNEIINRPKMGFSFPWDYWLRNELFGLVDDSIQKICERPEFNEQGIRRMWAAYLKNDPAVRWNQIWQLVSLEQWLKRVNL